MLRRTSITAVLAFVALTLPLTLTAQVAQPAPAAADLQNLTRELQQLNAQIQPLREQALQDESLRAEHSTIEAAIRQALVAASPNIEAQLDRAEKIRAEVAAAQSANDAEKVAALNSEAEAIQAEIEKAKEQALAQPELSAQVAAFNEKVNARIVELNAEAKTWVARQQELEQQIKRARAGAAGGK